MLSIAATARISALADIEDSVRGSRIVAPNAVAVLIRDAQSGLRPRMT